MVVDVGALQKAWMTVSAEGVGQFATLRVTIEPAAALRERRAGDLLLPPCGYLGRSAQFVDDDKKLPLLLVSH